MNTTNCFSGLFKHRCARTSTIRSFAVVAFAALVLALSGCSRSLRVAAPVAPSSTWHALESDRFEIYTDLSERDARRAMEDLTKTYDVLHDVMFPEAARIDTRLRVVIFRKESEYEPYAKRGADAFVRPSLPYGGSPGAVIVMWGEVDGYKRTLVAHELAHVLARGTYPWMPVWLNEGLAEYASTIGVLSGDAYLGKTPRHIVPEIRGRLPPVERLLAMGPSQFYAKDDATSTLSLSEEDMLSGNYAAAWGVVHMLMNGPRRVLFGEYLHRLRAGEREAAWRETFWATPTETLDAELQEHMVRLTGVVWKTPYEYPKHEEGFAMRPMSASEVLVLEGRILANEKTSPAFFAEAARIEPRSAAPHLALAYAGDDAQLREGEIALSLEPSNAEAIRTVATALAKVRDRQKPRPPPSDRERALWRTLVRSSPTAMQLNDAAWVLAHDGEIAEALTLAKRSVTMRPLCYECMDTLAFALARTGDFASACKVERRAIELAPEGADVADLERSLLAYDAANRAAGARRPDAAH